MHSVKWLDSINPSNYQRLGSVPISTMENIDCRVRNAVLAAPGWSMQGLERRVAMLRKAVEEFASRKEEFALLESREMGMPINEALADYDGVLTFANWYLDNAENWLSPETTFESDTEIHQVYREPIGVAAVIIPWNYPFLNFVWGTFQSLIAGNTVVLKHSEECPLSGLFIEEVMNRHLPEGVFGEVYGYGGEGEMLASHDKVNLIHFVGSTVTGQRLYELAGMKFIKSVMELGGSAPGIIFEDADVESAVRSVCEFRLSNNGQYCDGLKRLIVHERIFDDVVERLAVIFRARRIGVAEDPNTESGPLVAKRQLIRLAQQVDISRLEGARVLAGGESLEHEMGGAFYRPTLLTKVEINFRVWEEEVFGPVLPVMAFNDEREAVELANATSFGLGSYVYSADLDRASRVASKLQTGMVSINGMNYTTPWNPFGGWKKSGMGREHGRYGFHEVTQLKVVARPKR